MDYSILELDLAFFSEFFLYFFSQTYLIHLFPHWSRHLLDDLNPFRKVKD
jgi:hypothetical protein